MTSASISARASSTIEIGRRVRFAVDGRDAQSFIQLKRHYGRVAPALFQPADILLAEA